MYGWPRLHILCVGTSDEARAVLQLFHGDAKHVQVSKAEQNPIELQLQYIQRSQFQTLAAQQLDAGAKYYSYEPVGEYVDHANNRTIICPFYQNCRGLQQPQDKTPNRAHNGEGATQDIRTVCFQQLTARSLNN